MDIKGSSSLSFYLNLFSHIPKCLLRAPRSSYGNETSTIVIYARFAIYWYMLCIFVFFQSMCNKTDFSIIVVYTAAQIGKARYQILSLYYEVRSCRTSFNPSAPSWPVDPQQYSGSSWFSFVALGKRKRKGWRRVTAPSLWTAVTLHSWLDDQ